MKGKVYNVLKTLLANKGLNKEELEGLAEIAAKNLTEESTEEEINNAASGVVPFAEIAQKMGNRMVTAAVKKYDGWVDPKTIQTPEPPTPPTPTPAPEPKGLTAEEIQKLIAEGIANGLKPMQEERERERLNSLLFGHEKVKNIPNVFRTKYHLDKEEDLESVASQVETEYAAFKQELIKSGEFAAPPTKTTEEGETDDLIRRMHDMVADASK